MIVWQIGIWHNFRTGINFLWFLLLYLCMSTSPVFASDCEILEAQFFRKQQDVIVTDWRFGAPYLRLKTEIYPCAGIRVKNTFWQALKSEDIEVTATFTDESTKAKKLGCEERILEPGEEFSCSVCFESDLPVSRLECRFR
ncbi:MAG: hypothetical protein RDU01_00765 [Thermodesulfovibrionales bacterium]|nr:hypothetical protein [Thermodesulfovibrionales bacterium]